MANYVSIFVIGLLCHVFLFEPALLSASTFKLGTVPVNGNNRLSDEAIINYARLNPNEILSTEDLNTAYTKVLDTGLFKTVAFKQDGRNLIITCLLYTSPSPRDGLLSRMPSSA